MCAGIVCTFRSIHCWPRITSHLQPHCSQPQSTGDGPEAQDMPHMVLAWGRASSRTPACWPQNSTPNRHNHCLPESLRETEIHPAPDASLLSQSHCPEGTTESTACSAVLQGGMPWPRSLQQGSGGQSLSQVNHSGVTSSHPGWSHPGVPASTEWAVSASGVRDSLQTSGSPPCLPSALFILLTGGEA